MCPTTTSSFLKLRTFSILTRQIRLDSQLTFLSDYTPIQSLPALFPIEHQELYRDRKNKNMIQWADGRASFRVVPSSGLEEWGIDLEKARGW